MKTLFSFLFLSLLFFTSCESRDVKPIDLRTSDSYLKSTLDDEEDHFDKTVGQLSNGDYIILMDINEVKSKWEDVLNKNTDLSVSLDEISIVQLNGMIHLKGVDFSNPSVSIIPLVLKDGKLYEMKVQGGGYTVTCSGCTSTGPGSSGECEPTINPGHGYYCSDCSDGTCTKSTTYDPGGIF